MDDVLLVQAVLDLTGLGFLDGLAQVGGHGAGLGVGHQAARSEQLAETADLAHHVGGGDHDVEVHEAALDLGDQIVVTDDISAGSLGGGSRGALGDGADADGLAGAVGQHDGAADLLVGVTAVNAQADVQLNGLVELGGGQLAGQLQRLGHIIQFGGIDLLGSVDIMLAVFHCLSSYVVLRAFALPLFMSQPSTVTPMLRQVPRIMLHAASREAAFRSGILVFAISST